MSVLEEKIRKNKELFDAAEPPEGHFERFREKLDIIEGEEIKPIRLWYRGKALKIAALFIALMSVSLVLFLVYSGDSGKHIAANALPEELQEVKSYYNDLADRKMDQINQCAMEAENPEAIITMAKDEIDALDNNTISLEGDLQQNGENERVKNALIVNYKTKSDLLDNILKRLCNI